MLCLISVAAYARSPEGAPNTQRTIDKLNGLLRGEISAIETYRKAIDKVADEPGAAQLIVYRQDHMDAVEALQKEIARVGGTPSTDSGAWGTWANTVQQTANLFGDTAALVAIKNGEEKGLSDYSKLVADPDLPESLKDVIREKFMKNQQTHIDGLDEFIKKVKQS